MKKWAAVRIGGQKWGIYLVSPKSKLLLNEDGETLIGCCDYDVSKIYLSNALAAPAFQDTLIHEIFHAALFVSGAEDAYGGDRGKEERLVKALTPVWHGVLLDLGFEFPRGVFQ